MLEEFHSVLLLEDPFFRNVFLFIYLFYLFFFLKIGTADCPQPQISSRQNFWQVLLRPSPSSRCHVFIHLSKLSGTLVMLWVAISSLSPSSNQAHFNNRQHSQQHVQALLIFC